MVNPGHPSRGCQRCRSRKIKCDEGAPSCGYCTKKQRRCIYPDNIFRSVEVSSTGKVQSRTPAGPLNCRTALMLQTRQSPIPHPQTEPLRKRFSYLSPYDDHFFLTVLSRVLFPNILGGECQWPGYFALYRGRDSLSYRALQTLARACTGQVAHQPGLIQQALRSYNSCLRLLNARLGQPEVHNDEDVLIPVIIFGGLESLFLMTRDGWIRHTLGLAALFDLRGPDAFTPDGIAWQVFRSCRQVMVMAALSANEPTFLARPEWLGQPWIASQSSKNAFEKLVDLVAELPQLNVRSLQKPCENERAELHQNILDLMSRLSDWRMEWNMSPDGEEFFFPTPPTHNGAYPHDHLGPPLGYLSPYSAFCDTLFQGAHIFAINLALTTVTSSMEGTHELAVMAERTAFQICRSVPYFMTTQRSKLDVLWAMRLAWKELQRPNTPMSIKTWLNGQANALAACFEAWMGGNQALGTATWDLNS